MNKKGVTLLELIIVMVIIAIGALALAPGIGTWINHYRLRSAARDIASMLRTAQIRAVSTNDVYGVSFDASSCQLYRSSGGLFPDGGQMDLPGGVQFTTNTFPVNGTLNKHFAQFNSDSTASSGHVTLKNTKGTERSIYVSSSTGRIRID